MENKHAGSYTEIRYGKWYAILTICLGILLIALAILNYFNSFGDHSIVITLFFLIGGLIILLPGITLINKTYVRIDKENQIVTIFGITRFFARKYPYDKIYLEEKKFYIERNDKKKFLDILHYACNREDLNDFIKEIAM